MTAGRPQKPPQPQEPLRLQKLLANAGLGSRRQIEQWIQAGRLTVDGQVAALGVRASAQADIRLDGRPVKLPSAAAEGPPEVLLYYKPLGEVTTRADPAGRPTVFAGLPQPQRGRWVVVGRLDVNTTGVLLFTTDGTLAHRLMHPSAQIEREYRVRVRGRPSAAVLQQLRRGVELADGPARFEQLEPEPGADGAEGSRRWFRVVLREGRNREVRRLWEAVGCEVSRLTRMRYGPVQLPSTLAPAQWRRLDRGAVEALLQAVEGAPAPLRKLKGPRAEHSRGI